MRYWIITESRASEFSNVSRIDVSRKTRCCVSIPFLYAIVSRSSRFFLSSQTRIRSFEHPRRRVSAARVTRIRSEDASGRSKRNAVLGSEGRGVRAYDTDASRVPGCSNRLKIIRALANNTAYYHKRCLSV